MDKFELPPAPAEMSGPVKAWNQCVVIPTYRPLPPDRNPMFLERRVYQGSSGRVYPLPFTDHISEVASEETWDAVHLENEYIRLMILPQFGGRIHVGLDKTNDFDFFYRQNVIKPALVGLAGPWISGGVEFNWPQHHRPSTFLPTDVQIEHHADGSTTVWCSEHEPMNRMKGMHGVCLHPGKAIIELKVRLYNRTELVQTFLWWANVAARVHERYQSFFPPDVSHVADHAKRATSQFPLCKAKYYGVDYGHRATNGVASDELPKQFVSPPSLYAANDLAWYANIPVPTSYMAMGSREDFFGGYDHAKQAGFIHFANHHIAPGKKQWTWGNHEFGYAWDRNLTDDDGPYIELMAGVYTDNQPDFSFLHPGETRTFSQYWYPIQKIGPAHKANLEAAVSLILHESVARLGVAVTSPLNSARVKLLKNDNVLKELSCDIAPDRPLVEEVPIPPGSVATEFRLCVEDAYGRTAIEYQPAPAAQSNVPPPAQEPPLPQEIKTNDELNQTGLHLEQYRHATRLADEYWHEALRRDPADSRANNFLGLWHLRRGEFAQAAAHFERAIETLTRLNPNPYDGEPFYNLGLALRYMGRDSDAYDCFYKATWNYAWQSPAFYALAQIDCRRRQWSTALDHLNRALRVNTDHLQARNLLAIVLRKLGRPAEADEILQQNLALDGLDHCARHLAGQPLDCDDQVRLDLSLDFAQAGLYEDAIKLLRDTLTTDKNGYLHSCDDRSLGSRPMIHYYLGYFLGELGRAVESHAARQAAQAVQREYCFPSRLTEIAILQSAIDDDPHDACARYYLGNLFYDRRRHRDAITLWEASASIDPTFSTVWRNLGIACFNVLDDPPRAKQAYDKAFAADPNDAKVLYERDQLWKRTGELPSRRLSELERFLALVRQRDDLSIELCALYNQMGQHERALEVLKSRRFQPWEGGEGLALGQNMRTHISLGRKALQQGNARDARRHFESTLHAPKNLGEARHLLANLSDVHYWLGIACRSEGDLPAAQSHFKVAANFRGDFQAMEVRTFSEMTLYSALAMRELGRATEADQLLRDLLSYARNLEQTPARVDYFATSLPAMLLFKDDLQFRQQILSKFLSAQALLGLGDKETATEVLAEILRQDPNYPLAAGLFAMEMPSTEIKSSLKNMNNQNPSAAI